MQQLCNCKLCLPFSFLISAIILLIVRLHFINFSNIKFLSFLNYENEREYIINEEKWQQFGGSIILNRAEEKANKILMKLKKFEYERWENNVTLTEFNGDFLKMRKEIKKSLLYRVLKQMPKGAALHVHDIALANQVFLLDQTYRKDLWLCLDDQTEDYKLLRFSLKMPNETVINCQWYLLSELRSQKGYKEIDLKLTKSFVLSSKDKCKKEKLSKIKQLLKGLITFAPVWQDYWTQVFFESALDRVQYLEIHSSLSKLYDLEGKYYDEINVVEIMRNASILGSQNDVNLYGSSLIYSLPGNINGSIFNAGLQNAILYKLLYPDYVIGVDVINDYDLNQISKPLKYYSHYLLEMQDHLDYYLTSSVQSWHNNNNNSSDEDILESYLLGTKRITFHKSLLDHPVIIRKLANKNIAIVINPIFDQVFHNLLDLRYHPASILFRYNLPLVVSSSYPKFWQADHLTDDYYMIFMYLAAREGDLKVLKQLALNSLNYSGLDEYKKLDVLKLWSFLWSQWICQINHIFM